MDTSATVAGLSTDLRAFVRTNHGHLMTDSRYVSEVFGRRHGNVLRDIVAMLESKNPVIAEFGRLNFEPSSYSNAQNKQQRMYAMTAKGMAELTMGWSGEKSCELRIRFIEAFEQVADDLARVNASVVDMIHRVAKDEAESRGRGRAGSKLMLDRKREKPQFDERLANLLALVQGQLFDRVQ